MCFIRACCITLTWNMILVIVVSYICLKGDRPVLQLGDKKWIKIGTLAC